MSEAAWEPVIGLEIHVQLNTATKMFCACENHFGAEPNTLTCPLCLGHPGVLPVINQGAVEKAIEIGLALNCAIAERSVFHRKNYFYPDSPKAYQISQYDEPICLEGHLDVDGGRIGITRAHLEEDAAKLVHSGGEAGRIGGAEYSLVDFNRCGTPLVEIVTEPDLRSPEQAVAFLALLKNTLQTIGVSDCDMEKGSLRCDANVSVRRAGSGRVRHQDRAQEHELVQVPGRRHGGRDPAPDRPAGARAAGRAGDAALRPGHEGAAVAALQGGGARLPLLPGAGPGAAGALAGADRAVARRAAGAAGGPHRAVRLAARPAARLRAPTSTPSRAWPTTSRRWPHRPTPSPRPTGF